MEALAMDYREYFSEDLAINPSLASFVDRWISRGKDFWRATKFSADRHGGELLKKATHKLRQ
jgi:hypothetical protein